MGNWYGNCHGRYFEAFEGVQERGDTLRLEIYCP
jgi:hypothetical protein